MSTIVTRNVTAPKIVDPAEVQVRWIARHGEPTVEIIDPYEGKEDSAVLIAPRGDCPRCNGRGTVGVPGAWRYHDSQCFRCHGTGGEREVSTVGAERARISTHPTVLQKLAKEVAYIETVRAFLTPERVAQLPQRP